MYMLKKCLLFALFCILSMMPEGYGEKGISHHSYSDGKYNITEVQEEIAAETIYEKNGQIIHKKADRDFANYTLIHAKQVGGSQIICPSCGVPTTREALLDGCDYCGTKFQVEDLGRRVDAYAFRPDYALEYLKYTHYRNKIAKYVIAVAVIAVIVFFTGIAFKFVPEIMEKENVRMILSIAATLFAMILSPAFFIPAVLIVYAGIFFPLIVLLGGADCATRKVLKKLKTAPQFDRQNSDLLRKTDPNFSIAGFYSGVQNKIASVIYAENETQISAFASKDLKPLLGQYANVVGVDTEYLGITRYEADQKLQYVDVTAFLKLTEYDGRKFVFEGKNGICGLKSPHSARRRSYVHPLSLGVRPAGYPSNFLKERNVCIAGTN